MHIDTDLILHIDTASERGLVMLASDEKIIAQKLNFEPMHHASWLHPAIDAVMHEAGVKSTQVKAVAVANGPGSYTGLRVGLAAAKGLCFAWNLPLITLCSLKIMAKAVCLIRDFNMEQMGSAASIAVLVDARRMEVFYGVFNTSTLGVEEGPAAREVNNEFLLNFYSKGQLLCTGNGCAKWLNLVMHEAITYVELPPTEVAFAKLSSEAFTKKDYADLPYSEPFYIKPFYSTAKRS